MSLPRDFLEEVEAELRLVRHSLVAGADRAARLEQLLELTRAVAAHLRRPVTVWDVIGSAPDSRERERRLRLIRQSRSC